MAVFRKERWDAFDPVDFVGEAPLLAVEVVSPGNRHPKLLTKVDLYLRHGAEQVWLVYPKKQTVTVLSQNGDNKEYRSNEAMEFLGLHIVVADLFA